MNPTLHIACHPLYAHPLPEGHRFPMLKYELIPGQLQYEGTAAAENFFEPQAAADTCVLLAHTQDYVDKLREGRLSPSEQRRIGFPQTPALIEREWVITGGTMACCHYAMEAGVSLNVAGGTHHAFADRGEGFCLLNDFAVAAHYLLQQGLSRKILIIDLDVHQGNGTAAIFAGDARVFTFSMHGGHNYPFIKERSDLDIPLPDGTGDAEYLRILEEHLPALIENLRPDFAFYLSGVDVLHTDPFGRLQLTLEGCRRRDALVFSELRNRGIPCTVAMGGGYSKDVRVIVEAHCQTFRTAKDLYGLH